MVTGREQRVDELERRRVQVLADRLQPDLHSDRQLIANVGEVEDVERWRAAARLAGHRLGWRMRTGVAPAGVAWATSLDTPRRDRASVSTDLRRSP